MNANGARQLLRLFTRNSNHYGSGNPHLCRQLDAHKPDIKAISELRRAIILGYIGILHWQKRLHPKRKLRKFLTQTTAASVRTNAHMVDAVGVAGRDTRRRNI